MVYSLNLTPWPWNPPSTLLARRVSMHLAAHGCCPSVHDKSNNETVETQDFGKNENENHADEKSGLLGSSSYTGVTDNTDSKASSETSETDRETSTKLCKSFGEGHLGRQVTGDEDRNDETVDSDNTSHDDGDNTLHHQVRSEHGHGRDSNARLRGTITGTDAGENDGAGAAHGTEEGGVYGAKI